MKSKIDNEEKILNALEKYKNPIPFMYMALDRVVDCYVKCGPTVKKAEIIKLLTEAIEIGRQLEDEHHGR